MSTCFLSIKSKRLFNYTGNSISKNIAEKFIKNGITAEMLNEGMYHARKAIRGSLVKMFYTTEHIDFQESFPEYDKEIRILLIPSMFENRIPESYPYIVEDETDGYKMFTDSDRFVDISEFVNKIYLEVCGIIRRDNELKKDHGSAYPFWYGNETTVKQRAELKEEMKKHVDWLSKLPIQMHPKYSCNIRLEIDSEMKMKVKRIPAVSREFKAKKARNKGPNTSINWGKLLAKGK